MTKKNDGGPAFPSMTKKQLRAILTRHRSWVSSNGLRGTRANLTRANLTRADLSGANLYGANLTRADLSGANLYGANLTRANLSSANLTRADLACANLYGANLTGADLSGANLSGADLSGANLYGANLYGANLYGADLTRADLACANLYGAYMPSPTVVLLAAWGLLSKQLTRELMRYDAANHPDPKAFDRWAKGGDGCPYAGTKIERAAMFSERRECWRAGPAKSAFWLMVRVIREKCANSDYHPKRKKRGTMTNAELARELKGE